MGEDDPRVASEDIGHGAAFHVRVTKSATMPQSVKKFLSFFVELEWIIFGLALGIGSFFAWFVERLGLTKILVDQNAHLNVTRQVVDSMTPGITQFGFWPPLLHVVMLPFVAIDPLYRSGLAGAFALVPFYGLAAVLLYKILVELIDNKYIGFAGAILFLLNPYAIYYAVTPMMEVLFLSFLFATVFFLIRWLKYSQFIWLALTAVAVSLASLTRFEGLILIPLTTVVIFVDLVRRHKKYQEIEALIILFFSIALVGMVIIFVYSWFFGNNPLAFLNSDWSSFNQQRDYLRPSEGQFLLSIRYLLHSSYYMVGKVLLIISVIAFVGLMFAAPSFEVLALGLVIASPFLFDLIALYRGNILLYVAELPPFDWFYNERYGLYSIGFSIIIPLLLAGTFMKSKLAVPAKIFIGSFFIGMLILMSGLYMYQVAVLQRFDVVVKDAEKFSLATSQRKTAEVLHEKYDFGKVLITRAAHDIVAVDAGIPLKDYIHESNYRYYDQALDRPWLFARWVVMYNMISPDTANIPYWSRKNEKISARWGTSELFSSFYDLVYQNNFIRLYKVRESTVKAYATEHHLVRSRIPSLNRELAHWDPATIDQEMSELNPHSPFVVGPMETMMQRITWLRSLAFARLTDTARIFRSDQSAAAAAGLQWNYWLRPRNRTEGFEKYSYLHVLRDLLGIT